MTRLPGVLEILGAANQSLPMVFDKPHSGTDCPDDSHPIADRSVLRMAGDTLVHTLFAGSVDTGAALQATLSDLAAHLADFVAAQPQRPTADDPRRLSR